jgi:hypothetical protein
VQFSQGPFTGIPFEFDDNAQWRLGGGRSGVGRKYANGGIPRIFTMSQEATNLLPRKGRKDSGSGTCRPLNIFYFGPSKLDRK